MDRKMWHLDSGLDVELGWWAAVYTICTNIEARLRLCMYVADLHVNACCMMPRALPCMCLAVLVVHGPVVCSATLKMGQSTSGPESQESPEVSMLPLPISNTDFKYIYQYIHSVTIVINTINHSMVLVIWHLLHQRTSINRAQKKTFLYIY